MQIQLERNQNPKMAFPWECIGCSGFNRGEPAHRHPSFDSVIARLIPKQKAAIGQRPLERSAGQ
jgi:hypothetical protein